MMKRIVSMLLLTGTLLIGNTVFAFYADESSAVNLGMVQSYSRSAINVIDDDGTAYTFVYDNRPHSDLGFWKLERRPVASMGIRLATTISHGTIG